MEKARQTELKKIMSNYKILVDNLDFDEIKDYLLSNMNDFSHEDMEIIDSQPTRYEKIRKLLKILITKESPNTLKVLCDAMRATEVKAYKTLADYVEKTDVSFVEANIFEEASLDKKLDKLLRSCQGHSKLFSQPLGNIEKLEQYPEFKKLNADGKFVVNKTVEDFCDFENITLKLKPEKRKDRDAIKEISCLLGKDAVTSSGNVPPRNKYINAFHELERRLTADDKEKIDNCIKSLHILEMVGYPTVETIANEMFTECNWGRIVVWFAFWRQLAEHFEGSPKEHEMFGNYIGFQLASKKQCRDFIEEKGGWDSIVVISSTSSGILSYLRYLFNLYWR